MVGKDLYLPVGVRALAGWGVVVSTPGRVQQHSLHAALSVRPQIWGAGALAAELML